MKDKMSYKIFNIQRVSRKSQGLSIQTIVLAVLALFVLVVMIIIFAEKAKPVSDFYGECTGPQLNGVVVAVDDGCPEEKPHASPFVKEEGRKCCIDKIM